MRYQDGREVHVEEAGFPLVPHPDDGWSPVDDERARWADGTEFRREDWSRSVDGGDEHGVRILMRRGEPPRPAELLPGAGDLESKRWLGERLAALGVAQDEAVHSIEVRLVDDPERSALPDLIRRRAVFAAYGLGDRTRPRLVARHRTVRERVEARLADVAQRLRCRHGVEAVRLPGASGPWLRVTGTARCLQRVIEEEEVMRVAEDSSRLGKDYTPSREDVCATSSVYDPPLDVTDTTCSQGGNPSRVDLMPFMHQTHAMINAQDYLDHGYTGEGVAGLAQGWDVGPNRWGASRRHLTLGVFDNPLVPTLPAFRAASLRSWNRVKIYAGPFTWAVDDAAINTVVPNIQLADDGVTDDHGTRVAAIAMGNVTNLQDVRIADGRQRSARSGVGQGASGFFCDTAAGGATGCLAMVRDPDTGAIGGDVFGYNVFGLDVVNFSGSQGGCSDKLVAFGLDPVSEAFTDAYLDRSVLTVKSAGNLFADEERSACWDNLQLQAPASSPAVLTVGGYETNRSRYSAVYGTIRTAAEAQRSGVLAPNSSGGKTGDGRTHPLVVAPHWSCGAATGTPAEDYEGPAQTPGSYGGLGATSGSAPKVAGAALLLKHWYLSNHGGDIGNSPGRVMSNLLNMGDGVVFETTPNRSLNNNGNPLDDQRIFGERVTAPTNAWGLGHFRMRRFEDTGMASPYFRSTVSVVLSDAHPAEFIPLAGEGGRVPKEAKRLRITVWWTEMNTGEGEDKASFTAWLCRGADFNGLASTTSGGNHLLRFDFDCFDAASGWCPRGDLRLWLWADSVPAEVRHPRRDYRTLYVSWFWECGPDPSLIGECGGVDLDWCDPFAADLAGLR